MDKIEDINDKLDIMDMKLNELKRIQHNHDNQIRRLNYNFRYDLLKVKSYNKIIMLKKQNKNNHKNEKKTVVFKITKIILIILILIYSIYTFPISYRNIYSQIL